MEKLKGGTDTHTGPNPATGYLCELEQVARLSRDSVSAEAEQLKLVLLLTRNEDQAEQL